MSDNNNGTKGRQIRKIYGLPFIVLFIYCYHNIGGGDSNKKKYNEELFHQQ